MHFPITIGFTRSRWQTTVLLLIATLASLTALFFPHPLPWRGGLLLAIWSIAFWAWPRLKPPLAVIRLEADGSLQVKSNTEDDFAPATLLPGASVHPWLTILRLELANGQRRALLVTAGTMPPDQFRRLRVFLRWRVVSTAKAK
ncbi:MAG: hypothetical protein LBE62_14025 [Azonexus sp.]|jgi:toxin CptA|nr:hypothetical protein [Azonexus sp.]